MADEAAFTTLFEQHRAELRVHCYRMLGSLDEADDLVQETFLRAWRGLDGFQGRSSPRAWLYRIATNACLDALDNRSRRVLPYDLTGPAAEALPPRTDIPWLQPYPDAEPDSAVVSRETIELAFLAALQHLPARQRAILILADVLGWPARQTASLLGTTAASVNSSLRRARTTLREHLPERRLDWASATGPTDAERALLRRYMDAMERADLTALADLLAEDIRTAMPPWPMWLLGRDAVLSALATSWDTGSGDYVGRFRMVPVQANRQPAVATYVRRAGDTGFGQFAISLLRISGGRIVEIDSFHDPGLFPAFDLPASLSPAQS
ncbi:sigma-70 family RNA polymerase sigma factor [Amycolatopsis suaedae]|uniref:RNA polymerase sigma factor n=1 Tax=Amycolatopsis suaedae TaxID=2510978 RepID=A0A4Q7IWG6_9PSEU|nr:sigma-70 family RNA polymerase sigma factor [Amycolatopsis suaedae]RZQ59261.1 sigma-70 family RNA polymerase sigma factor [Amycolatopsis suaedae]